MADTSESNIVDFREEWFRRADEAHPDGGEGHFFQSDLDSEDFGMEADDEVDGGEEHIGQSELGSEEFGMEADGGEDHIAQYDLGTQFAMLDLEEAWMALAPKVDGIDPATIWRGAFEALKSLKSEAEDVYAFTEARTALTAGTVTRQMSEISNRWGMFLIDVKDMDIEAERRISSMAPSFEAASRVLASALAKNPGDGKLSGLSDDFTSALGKTAFSLRPSAGKDWHPIFKLAMGQPQARNVLRGMLAARVSGYGDQVKGLQVDHADLLAVKSDRESAVHGAKARVETLKLEKAAIEVTLDGAWKKVGEESRRKSLVARIFSPLLNPEKQARVADAMERLFGSFGAMTTSMVDRVMKLGGGSRPSFGTDKDKVIPTPYTTALKAKDAVKERLEAKKGDIREAKAEVKGASTAVSEAARDATAKLREIGSREKAAKSLGWLVSKIDERTLKDETARRRGEAQPSLALGRSQSRSKPAQEVSGDRKRGYRGW
ncbi:MAG: hypothetical protein VR70_04045 [Rhodospirillaceae bacterium BRH_c57]|nr:MAG: hypothetical protein VR70_04045 [Rhodospirillaceae bacterium BRH_c57]